MQQPGPMFPVMPSFPPTNITTEQIQKCIHSAATARKRVRFAFGNSTYHIHVVVTASYTFDTGIVPRRETRNVIFWAILDNQNLGKLAECAQYQAQLQKNLMYLAAIADAQPQTPAMPTQMTPHPAMQQGGFYMQHPQAAAMAQQPGNKQDKADGGAAANSDGQGNSAVVHGGGDAEEAK
ncbi:UNVERIFIED_CONTAM: G-interacting factor 3 [Sesamum radiatum]|uniref:G-interacting factor 3 n=1 Tax=Sesamum radiatum TaxID=300843 RepID=A0AAW2URX3_SESRA